MHSHASPSAGQNGDNENTIGLSNAGNVLSALSPTTSITGQNHINSYASTSNDFVNSSNPASPNLSLHHSLAGSSIQSNESGFGATESASNETQANIVTSFDNLNMQSIQLDYAAHDLLSPSLPIPSQEQILTARAKASPIIYASGFRAHGDASLLSSAYQGTAQSAKMEKRKLLRNYGGRMLKHGSESTDDEDGSNESEALSISPVMQTVCIVGLVCAFLGMGFALYYVLARPQSDQPPLYRHRSRFGPKFAAEEDAEDDFAALWTPTLKTETFITGIEDSFSEGPLLFANPKTHEPIYLKDAVPNAALNQSEEARILKVESPSQAEKMGYVPALRYLFVELYANWCGHCRRFAPHVERLGMMMNGDTSSPVRILKVDCAKNGALCGIMDVRSYPTLYFADERKWNLLAEYLRDNAYDTELKKLKKGTKPIPENLVPTKFDGTPTAESVTDWIKTKLKENAKAEIEQGGKMADGKVTVEDYHFSLIEADKFSVETKKRARSAAKGVSEGNKGINEDLAKLSSIGSPQSINKHDSNLYLAIAIREALSTCSAKVVSNRSPSVSVSRNSPNTQDIEAVKGIFLASDAHREAGISPSREQDSKELDNTNCYEAIFNWLDWLCELHVDTKCRPSLCQLRDELPKWLPAPNFVGRNEAVPASPPENSVLWIGHGSAKDSALEHIRSSQAKVGRKLSSFSRATFEREFKFCGMEWSYWDYKAQWQQCRGSRPTTRGYTCGLWLTIHSMAHELADRESFFVQASASSKTDDNTVIYEDDQNEEIQVKERTSGDKALPNPPSTPVARFVRGLRTYLRHFFPCKECQKHFLMYSLGLDVAVSLKEPLLFTSTELKQDELLPVIPSEVLKARKTGASKSVARLPAKINQPAAQLALWLWATHNSVNSRLAKVETESNAGDPVFPKSLFPSDKLCPECRVVPDDGLKDRWKVLWKLPDTFDRLEKFYLG